MYQRPLPQNKYDKQFTEKFMKENGDLLEVIKGWRRDPNKHKHEDKDMYTIASIVEPYCYIAAMMCRLFGYSNTQKFSDQWVPLIDAASDGYVMDRGTILSNNICTQILNYRKKHTFFENIIPHFYMSAYIMDYICFTFDFTSMGWKWTIEDPMPIHI